MVGEISLRERRARKIAETHMQVNHLPPEAFELELKVSFALLDAIGVKDD